MSDDYQATLYCRRCRQEYKVHKWAEKFGLWICYVLVAPNVRCWTINVWK